MNIPSKFQIFGQTWVVKQPPKVLVNGESLLGHCDSDKCVIQLRRNLKKELKEVVFLHEIMHAILFSLDYIKLGRDESFVERTSKALHQVLTTME